MIQLRYPGCQKHWEKPWKNNIQMPAEHSTQLSIRSPKWRRHRNHCGFLCACSLETLLLPAILSIQVEESFKVSHSEKKSECAAGLIFHNRPGQKFYTTATRLEFWWSITFTCQLLLLPLRLTWWCEDFDNTLHVTIYVRYAPTVTIHSLSLTYVECAYNVTWRYNHCKSKSQLLYTFTCLHTYIHLHLHLHLHSHLHVHFQLHLHLSLHYITLD